MKKAETSHLEAAQVTAIQIVAQPDGRTGLLLSVDSTFSSTSFVIELDLQKIQDLRKHLNDAEAFLQSAKDPRKAH